eukprot:IDg21262t1
MVESWKLPPQTVRWKKMTYKMYGIPLFAASLAVGKSV